MGNEMNLGEWQILVRVSAGEASWTWVPLGEGKPATRGCKLWAVVKVVRTPKRPGRNAYQIAYSLAERRIGEGARWEELKEREPELAAPLVKRLADELRVDLM